MEYVPDNYDQFLKHEKEEQEEDFEQPISNNREL